MRTGRLLLTFGSSAVAAVLLAFTGCGVDGAPSGDDESGDDSGVWLPPPSSTDDGGGGCGPAGKACGDGGVCAGGECCPAELACGDVCCPTGNVCSFQKCAVPGAECRDSTDCAAGEYCEYSLGTSTDGGTFGADASCVVGNDRTGRCLPRPPQCPPDAGPPPVGGPITCLEKCEHRPETPTFTLTEKFSWGGQTVAPYATDVMMAPIVIELDDDDCDGRVTERDIPEIVFATFENGKYKEAGKLHAISIVNGAIVEKWTIPNANNATVVNPTRQIAGGNFDGQPGNEIVACGRDGKVYAFRGHDGSFLWDSKEAMPCFMPSIADLDGDGKPEVIVEGGILDGATGDRKHAFDPPLNGPFVVSDIDGDGKLDVVTASRAYDQTGKMFVDTGMVGDGSFPNTSDWKGPWAAVGDFDLDGKPEIVAVDNDKHEVHVWRYDATKPDKFTVVRQPVDMNARFETNHCGTDTWGRTHGGGPPTIADFDRDGVPDVGLAGGIGYVVFDGKKLVDPAVADPILWSKRTTDCSSASTGSTVFDFDGDGKAEVVYSDEHRMRIYDGATGDELASICNTTATLIEFPLVADVDNDGQADIVVVSNAYDSTCNEELPDGGTVTTKQSGVRIFGPANGSWVRTRRIWNQHAYHITNVAEDGTIPANEPANWKQPGLNNFRQNKQPGSEFAAPNLVATIAPLCSPSGGVTVTVRNVGEAVAPAGVEIGIYSGTPGSGTRIGSVTTTRPLYPAEAEPLDFSFTGSPPSSVFAVIDDAGTPHPSWTECRTDDNTTKAIAPVCSGGPK